MNLLTGARERAGQGFTLVELLLSIAVMLLLIGGLVFSFSTFLAGSQLNEGADRFESLIRLARAHAAQTGKKVQLVFREDVTDASEVVGRVEVAWEPDPLDRPGYWEKMREVAWVIEGLNDMIAIENVRLTSDPAIPVGFAAESEAPPWLAPITFYPDGAADSAAVLLASRDPEDEERVMLRLQGLSGVISRETVAPAGTDQKVSETLQDSSVGSGIR